MNYKVRLAPLGVPDSHGRVLANNLLIHNRSSDLLGQLANVIGSVSNVRIEDGYIVADLESSEKIDKTKLSFAINADPDGRFLRDGQTVFTSGTISYVIHGFEPALKCEYDI
jgi:hypothetical protein